MSEYVKGVGGFVLVAGPAMHSLLTDRLHLALLSDLGLPFVAARHQAGQLLAGSSVNDLNTSVWDWLERWRWRRRRGESSDGVLEKLHQLLQLGNVSLHGRGRKIVLGTRDINFCCLGFRQIIGRWR